MTIHKLSARSGYEYLTRQVAALDSTQKGTTPLADYYSAKGESPGRWVGSGLVGIDGLEAGDVVTAVQMKHLFGTGSHPITGQPLGAAYKVYDNTGVDGFNAEVAPRVRATSGSRPPYDVLARVRSEVARERFVAEHGREPKNARELSDALARYSRPRQTAVAGFDLTFSPVKSVSALWAVAPAEVARVIEEAHDTAVLDALAFIEREVLFTREGRNGARQVETRGRIAAAFTHRDSRAGDPDLHTHVAIAKRCRRARASGCRSTARCCSSTPSPRRRRTAPRWSGGWSRRSGCSSRSGRGFRRAQPLEIASGQCGRSRASHPNSADSGRSGGRRSPRGNGS